MATAFEASVRRLDGALRSEGWSVALPEMANVVALAAALYDERGGDVAAVENANSLVVSFADHLRAFADPNSTKHDAGLVALDAFLAGVTLASLSPQHALLVRTQAALSRGPATRAERKEEWQQRLSNVVQQLDHWHLRPNKELVEAYNARYAHAKYRLPAYASRFLNELKRQVAK